MAKRVSGKGYVARFDFGKLQGDAELAAANGLRDAAIWLTGEIKRDLSKPGPSPRNTRPSERKKRRARARAANVELRASKPGEPPRRRTGTLGASITNEADKGGLIQRVGTAFKYGFWLEWGTKKLAPRPYLRPAITKNADKIAAFVKNAIKKGIR